VIERIPANGDYGRPADLPARALDWGAHERETMIAARRVRYVDIGEGTSGFVCVHGMGGSWQLFTELLPSLATHGRAIALDLPGFGGSQMPANRVTLELLADTAATLARLVGLERVIFIGHSMGGPIALRFATRHPALADGLILLAGATSTFSTLLGLREVPRIARERPADVAAIYTEVLTCGIPIPGLLKGAIAKHKLLRTVVLWPYLYRPGDLQPDAVTAILAGTGAPGVIPTARAIGCSHPCRDLQAIQCPILSIGATHDHIVPSTDLEGFDAIAPTARTVLLEGAGHLTMLERPQAVNEQIEQFLAGAGKHAR
jgi:pimeloyl-ACP methyl ester carboxylesterase